ncbi:hypothetical protein ACVLVH_000198 [Kluyvera sp. 1366]
MTRWSERQLLSCTFGSLSRLRERVRVRENVLYPCNANPLIALSTAFFGPRSAMPTRFK